MVSDVAGTRLGFWDRLSWAAAISFFMQIRHDLSRGSWLITNEVRGGKVVTPEVGPSWALARPDT